jgi:hypothetical protein
MSSCRMMGAMTPASHGKALCSSAPEANFQPSKFLKGCLLLALRSLNRQLSLPRSYIILTLELPLSNTSRPCRQIMHLVERFWTSLTYVASLLTLSPVTGPGNELQAPLLSPSDPFRHGRHGGPIFKPPGGRPRGPGSEFLCDYSNMPGFVSCSTPGNRSCWLRNSQTGFEYNINTNYEDNNLTPVGITRKYYLNITDKGVNADGLDFKDGKIFNLTYPGPWIQACWGDVSIQYL